jgi:plasmid stabilization system protein ParE
MTYALRPTADAEIDEIFAHYSQASDHIAADFIDRLLNELQAIGSHPGRCGWIDDHFRRCRMRKYPYLIAYAPTQTPVLIVAIYHAARRPDYWRSRVQ